MLAFRDQHKEVIFLRSCAHSFLLHVKVFQSFLSSRRYSEVTREILLSKFFELEKEYLHLRSVVDAFDETAEFYDDGL